METKELITYTQSLFIEDVPPLPSIEKLDVRPSVYAELKKENSRKRIAARNVYSNMRGEAEAKWKVWLASEFASELSEEITDQIYREAWEDGHSSGYGQVEYHYEKYAALANQAFKAGHTAGMVEA